MHAAAQPAFRRAMEPSPLTVVERRSGALPTAAAWPRDGAEAPREMSFAPGQTLFFDGDQVLHFFEIVSGTVRCCRLTLDGRRQIYRFAGVGDMLGLGGETVHGYSAEAVTAVVVRRHRLLGLDTAMAADGRLRERVLGALRDELAAVRLQMVLLGQMSASERVACFLLSLAERADGFGALIHLPMTRVDIADYLGLTIETVSRKINELKRLGVIDLETPTEFRVAAPDRLQAIAEAA